MPHLPVYPCVIPTCKGLPAHRGPEHVLLVLINLQDKFRVIVIARHGFVEIFTLHFLTDQQRHIFLVFIYEAFRVEVLLVVLDRGPR